MRKIFGVVAVVAVLGFSLLVFGQQGRGMQQGAGFYQTAIDSVILQGWVDSVTPDNVHGTSLVLQLTDKSKVTIPSWRAPTGLWRLRTLPLALC
jgi:hypothetical protein